MPIDTLSLEGKTAIVTGSGRENGIGAGIAKALARNGASVVIHYVSDSSANRAAGLVDSIKQSGGKAIAVQAAVDTIMGAKEIVAKTLAGFGTQHIDILVNNAGTGNLVDIFGELHPEEIDHVLHTNVNGPLYMVNSTIPYMPPGGRIINISSTQSQLGGNVTITYAASKAAVDNLTWSLAKLLGRGKGITVNSVSPGPVRTDLIPEELVDVILQPEIDLTLAADRAGEPEDIGDAVLLLVQEKARWITGQNISVSGGVTRGR
ncbi:hypothetical protein ACHAP8_008346 [Fusarium lateritium]